MISATEPVAKGKTLINYNSADAHVLSFAAMRDVTVYGKSMVQGNALWDVEIDGKRGLAPNNFIQEVKILKRELTYKVPVDRSKSKEHSDMNVLTANADGNATKESSVDPDKLSGESSVTTEASSDSNHETITLDDLNQYQVKQPLDPDPIPKSDDVTSEIETGHPVSETAHLASEGVTVSPSSSSAVDDVTASDAPAPYTIVDGTTFRDDESDVPNSFRMSSAAAILTARDASVSSVVSGIQPTLSAAKFYKLYPSATIHKSLQATTETPNPDSNTQDSTEGMSTGGTPPDANTAVLPSVADVPTLPSTMNNENAVGSINSATMEILSHLTTASTAMAANSDTLILSTTLSSTIEKARTGNNNVESSSVIDGSDKGNKDSIKDGSENHKANEDPKLSGETLGRETNVRNDETTDRNLEQGESTNYKSSGNVSVSETVDDALESNYTPLHVATTEVPNSLLDGALDLPPADIISDEERGFCNSFGKGKCDDSLVTQGSIFMVTAAPDEPESQPKTFAEPVTNEIPSSDRWTDFHQALHNYSLLLRGCLQSAIDLLPENLRASLMDLETKGLSPHVTLLTTVLAVTCFLIITTYYIIKRGSQERSLLGHICTIEQKLFAVTAERDVLKEELETSQKQATSLEEDLTTKDQMLNPLESELKETKNRTAQLQAILKDLQKMLDAQADTLAEMRSASEQKSAENEDLQQRLSEATHQINTLETSLRKTEMEASELREQKDSVEANNWQLRETNAQLESIKNDMLKETDTLTSRVAELQQQLQEDAKASQQLSETLALKYKEFEGLKDAVREMECLQGSKDEDHYSVEEMDEKIKQLLDTALVRQQVSQIKQDNRLLKEQISTLERRVLESDGQLADIREENVRLSSSCNQALQDKSEAETKLEVLSNYFKEKETRLQRELGMQEAMRHQKEDDASSATRRMALSEQESALYKSQLTAMKQDVEQTEQNYKNQVSLLEKKAHENWLAARAAERQTEEARQENGVLRQRLTLLEREKESWSRTQPDSVLKPIPHRFGSPNGEVPSPPNQTYSSEAGEFVTPVMLPDRSVVPPLLHTDFPPLPPFMLPPGLPFGDPMLPPPPLPPFPPLEPWRLPPPRGMPFLLEYEWLRHSTPPCSLASPLSTYSRDEGRHSPPIRELLERRPPSERFSPPYRDSGSRDSKSSSPPLPLQFHDRPPWTSRFPPSHTRPPSPPKREHPPAEGKGDKRGSDAMPRTAPFPPTTERRPNASPEV